MAKRKQTPPPNTIPDVTVTILDTILISSDPNNHRKSMDKQGLADLAESIKVHGVLQPITVRPDADGYMVVAGHRRLEATRKAGLVQIPAIIRKLTDDEALEIQILENLQREDVSPIDEAHAFSSLLKKGSIDMLASRINKPKSYVAGRLKLLDLNVQAQELVNAGTLPIGHATLIAKLSPEKQIDILNQIVDDFYFSDLGEDPISNNDPEDALIQYSYGQLQSLIVRSFKKISTAIFDINDEDLNPLAGSCKACPKRTCNQALLFKDITNEDECTDGDCFASKTKAHNEALIAAAKEKHGAKMATGKVFAWASDKIEIKGHGTIPMKDKPGKGLTPVLITESFTDVRKLGDVMWVDLNVSKKEAAKQAEQDDDNDQDEAFEPDEDWVNRCIPRIKALIATDKLYDAPGELFRSELRMPLNRIETPVLIVLANELGIDTGVSNEMAEELDNYHKHDEWKLVLDKIVEGFIHKVPAEYMIDVLAIMAAIDRNCNDDIEECRDADDMNIVKLADMLGVKLPA